MTTIDEIKESFQDRIIYGEPVYSLAECVSAQNTDDEDTDGDSENHSNPVEEIKERFRTGLYLCDPSQLDFLRFAAELSEKKAAWEDNIAYQPFRVFFFNDFVYLFSHEDKYYLVLPEELAAMYREAALSKGFAAANAYMLELSDYAAALLQLYGAYEREQFVTVWNHHHKNKITINEAEEFLSNRAYFDSDFYFIGDFVVHDCLFDDDFDELLEETEDTPYYLPTKSVIRAHAKRGHDDSKIPGEIEMDNFLAEYITDAVKLDDLQMEMTYSCERLESADEVMGYLAYAGAPLDDETFRVKFERLYNNLRDNTHIWELRGFTPPQYQSETGETISRFKLPKSMKRKKK